MIPFSSLPPSQQLDTDLLSIWVCQVALSYWAEIVTTTKPVGRKSASPSMLDTVIGFISLPIYEAVQIAFWIIATGFWLITSFLAWFSHVLIITITASLWLIGECLAWCSRAILVVLHSCLSAVFLSLRWLLQGSGKILELFWGSTYGVRSVYSPESR